MRLYASQGHLKATSVLQQVVSFLFFLFLQAIATASLSTLLNINYTGCSVFESHPCNKQLIYRYVILV